MVNERSKKGYTIVVEDNALLAGICGTHDENLVLFEHILGAPIRTRGNEITILSDDAGKIRALKKVVEELRYHVQRGHLPGRYLIESLFDSAFRDAEEETQLLKDVSISIRGGQTTIFPRTYNQAVYIQAMREHTMVFAIGPAGTGKTFLAVAHALEELISRKRKKLVLTRPVVEAGERLGFLPGDLLQKINPYLKPLYDAIDALIPLEMYQKMEEQRMIEIIPLAYMRGRSLDNSYIILDEAQNTTREQMKMFLTRLGQNSKAVITGDVTQIDLPDPGRSGLLHAESILQGIDEIRFSYFTREDVVRNPLVKKIIEAYERDPS
ncbi:PhoH family protein [Spirochaeta thermophila]|uniref:PhoH-like protein n=1 Tax=Winmispira thermophila (strain ATCC 49972 / DSM 6192 / RI 19.B1) TaxID=665571 RepID=E0RSD3_WINT6|nr:PhoH family protein [Spirochaeta thermophila]ADN01920.1 PhoH-like protein [Spirochaeta thermophila DSM 6192]